MAIKYYVSVTASPTTFVPAKTDRQAIAVQNISSSETIYLDFNDNPSATSGAWRIPPNSTLVLSVQQFPEIIGDVRLVASGNANVIIRDSSN